MPKKKTELIKSHDDYDSILSEIVELLEQSRRMTARSVNAIMTATYWKIGQRIVEVEQKGDERAEYGKELLKKLSEDLSNRFGRGFSSDNLEKMRLFYQKYSIEISETLSRKSQKSQTLIGKSKKIRQTVSAESFNLSEFAENFPLPWSHYVLLLSCKDENERGFYENEALRGGWSVRQLKRQINSQFYKRTLLSKNKAAMLEKGEKTLPEDYVSPDEEIKDPFVLEFLNLKDEYSELDLEEAIIKHLQTFLLEMGAGFAFIGRQMRLRVGDEWYRVDLVLFNRRLKCLVIIDLKLGKLTHADIGQMLLYTGYADRHWREAGENPPVGLILCAENNDALAHYTLDNLPNKVLAKEYKMVLPDEKILAREIEKTRRMLDGKKSANPKSKIPN
jgi:predicted nuclease of restriction endonuclease-like (RecB) superfamily